MYIGLHKEHYILSDAIFGESTKKRWENEGGWELDE